MRNKVVVDRKLLRRALAQAFEMQRLENHEHPLAFYLEYYLFQPHLVKPYYEEENEKDMS